DIKALHQLVHDKITKSNELIKYRRDKGRKRILFQPGDLVWVHFQKDRFPAKRRSKLSHRGEGPFKILTKVNDNAYKVDLPGTPAAAAMFNVTDLQPYYDSDEPIPSLRANFLEAGEDDRYNPHQEPIDVPDPYPCQDPSQVGHAWVVTKTLLDDANSGYKNGNFVCSPLSLDIILGMLAAGAEGQTLKQLLEFLGHESMEIFLFKSPSSKLFRKKISNPKAGLECSFANGVWVDKKVEHVQSSYHKVLKTVYKTKVSSVDFGKKRDKAVDVINSWVHKETKGLIPFIVKKSDLDWEIVMLIANAMYFKGTWSDPFDADKTIQKKFHLMNGEQVSVPFMTSHQRFDYGSYEGYKMIKLPYKSDKGKSNKFSTYIFLPHEKAGLKKLLQNFHSNDALFHGEFDLTLQKFDELWIPKFKISCSFEPKDVMKRMGLTLPFEETNKELSGIVEPDVMLYVSKILQKYFVEIDEKGTEAVACSAMFNIERCRKNYKPPPRPSFVADHPFMFMIREDSSQAVLIVGVVLNPLDK
ncbi:serpin-ZX, partial [Tanacetum coccineum]